MKKDCVFCKIIAGEIPSEKVYEDNLMIIIKDINPQVKKHFLLIPKKHYANIVEMSLEEAVELGESLKTLSTLVDDLGLQDGFKLVSNKGGNARQTVENLHIHILGGELLSDKMG